MTTIGKRYEREYQRSYKAQQRERWRAEGLCIVCGHEIERKRKRLGMVTCARCSGSNYERLKRRRRKEAETA